MNKPLRSRVTVDFPISERDLLQTLCDQDFRHAAEQVRWLVVAEATRRGLVNEESDTETLAGTGVTLRVS